MRQTADDFQNLANRMRRGSAEWRGLAISPGGSDDQEVACCNARADILLAIADEIELEGLRLFESEQMKLDAGVIAMLQSQRDVGPSDVATSHWSS